MTPSFVSDRCLCPWCDVRSLTRAHFPAVCSMLLLCVEWLHPPQDEPYLIR